MPKVKALSKDAAARQSYIDRDICGRCKVRPIDYDRSHAKCARCLDRAKAESVAKVQGGAPVYPPDSDYPPPAEAKPGRPPKGQPKPKAKPKKRKGGKAGARGKKV